MSFTYIDLFAGIGGFHLALDKIGGKCVFASEIDSKARNIYERNFSNRMHGEIVGDIIPLSENKISHLIPKHDVLVAGFPCQPFSKSGRQLGINETRGTLFYNIANILEKRKPKIVMLENVRNITGPRHAHTWSLMIRVLRDLGYRVSSTPVIYSPHLIPPKLNGAPQVRDRVYIFGTYVGKRSAWKNVDDLEPILTYNPVGNWNPTEWNLEKDLLINDSMIKNLDEYRISDERETALTVWEDFLKRVGEPEGGKRLPGFPIWEQDLKRSPKIDAEMPDWKIDFLNKNSYFYNEKRNEIKAWREANPGLTKFPNSFRKFEWQARNNKSIWDSVIQFRPSGIRVKKADYLPALVAMNQTSIIGKRRRTITIQEAAKLQSFPISFDFSGQNDATSFKQLGNAVSVSTVLFVLKEYLKYYKIELESVDL
jgi:DNA (cytosine-5)-methyltransferase 1